MSINLGIDRVLSHPDLLQDLGRISIVANQSSVSSTFDPVVDVIISSCSKTSGSQVVSIFGPQHGYFQTKQDNMIETPDSFYTFVDNQNNSIQFPLYSLYSEVRAPHPHQLQDTDTIIFDLTDVGNRVYTYMATLVNIIKVVAEMTKVQGKTQGKKMKVIVLDRPNPVGLCFKKDETWYRIEGAPTQSNCQSFVSMLPICFRHGLSMAEIGFIFCLMYFNSNNSAENLEFRDPFTVTPENYCLNFEKKDGILTCFCSENLIYQSILVENLTRDTSLNTLSRLSFSIPSPNLPCWETVFFYCYSVAVEATNWSEGRGSTVPFKLIGSQKSVESTVDLMRLLNRFTENFGVKFKFHCFNPTFSKLSGENLNGIFGAIFDYSKIDLLNVTNLGWLMISLLFDNKTNFWRTPKEGYEYDWDRWAIDLIYGSQEFRKLVENRVNNSLTLEDFLIEFERFCKDQDDFVQTWANDHERFFLY
ncbi:hypothetical protein RCL1_007932 [Eukaryota sp. TZLM3-RCL]